MTEWEAFLDEVPSRIVEVIERGPFPLTEYGNSSSLSRGDKNRGIMRFKGGDGRGHVSVKSGQQAVVYWDPKFCSPSFKPKNIPDPVLARHDKSEVITAFKKL